MDGDSEREREKERRKLGTLWPNSILLVWVRFSMSPLLLDGSAPPPS